MSIGCVVMASGEGRRFAEACARGDAAGSAAAGLPVEDARSVPSLQPGAGKLLVPLRGAPLIERTVSSVLAAGERAPFDVVVATRWPEVARLCKRLGARVVLHNGSLRSESVRAGLVVGLDRWDGCLFLPGDQPLVAHESFERLYAAFAASPDAVVRLGWHGAPGGPVLFPAGLFPQLMALTGSQGGSAVLSQAGRVLLVEAQRPEELWDVDTPSDLAALERALASRESRIPTSGSAS